MKITSVDLYQVTSGKPSVAGTYWKASICRINTDEGISGFGEAGVCYSSGSDAALGLSAMRRMRPNAAWAKQSLRKRLKKR